MIPIRDHNPTTRRPYVTVTLIAACILVHAWRMTLDPLTAQRVVLDYGFVPVFLFDGLTFADGDMLVAALGSLFSSMFLHGDLMHLGGNMLYLWVFGNNIEDAAGHGRFLVFYLLCGVVAALAQTLPDPASTVPMIGASGAISGVLGAYLLLFPSAKVQVIIPLGFIFFRTLSAGWILGFWIAFQVFSGVTAGIEKSGVAWWAHIGGFVAGMALIHLFKQADWKKGKDADPLASDPSARSDSLTERGHARSGQPKNRSKIPSVGQHTARSDHRKSKKEPLPPSPPVVERRRRDFD